ncbi:hypothetical protein PGS10_11590 [Klebsiella sp. 141153]|uniref:hypothetical protein n=1 Tax=Klebsiella sp. 141153 TaxID=3020033 RepID=UPI00292A0DBA|nr:hypothetical protein [Klebsiella sp. 141153]MDU9355284.1 hypothetical protein [Klebsiella sp. 141153]
MTKSTITRERIQRIIRAIDSESYDEEEIREWLSSDEIMELSRMALAAMDSEYDYDIHRDANRYRFLRDKDAFGDEGAPGLASWDDLAELDMGEFDSAVDARILSCEMPKYILTKAHERTGTAGVYAELYRLREEVKGPDGFDTWKDAAIAERKARVEIEKASQRVVNIDYLGAMAAFHSDQWHKMGPINGYIHGWNACRAAMLQSGILTGEGTKQVEPVTTANKLGNSPLIPDGYVMVPKEPTAEMVNNMRYHVGAYDRNIKEGYKAMLAAAPQEVKP